MSQQRQVTLQAAPPGANQAWSQLRDRVESCQACGLRATCHQTVLGEGLLSARIMLVGEGPGGKEDQMGRPFVGAAGKLLDATLATVDYGRSEVYITNVVKCRPPGNRLPKSVEVKACFSYLSKEIELVNPIIVVCLGVLATRTLLDPGAAITRVRGKSYQKDGRLVVPTFHPAALLRDPQKKRPVWEDMQLIKRLDEAT